MQWDGSCNISTLHISHLLGIMGLLSVVLLHWSAYAVKYSSWVCQNSGVIRSLTVCAAILCPWCGPLSLGVAENHKHKREGQTAAMAMLGQQTDCTPPEPQWRGVTVGTAISPTPCWVKELLSYFPETQEANTGDIMFQTIVLFFCFRQTW